MDWIQPLSKAHICEFLSKGKTIYIYIYNHGVIVLLDMMPRFVLPVLTLDDSRNMIYKHVKNYCLAHDYPLKYKGNKKGCTKSNLLLERFRFHDIECAKKYRSVPPQQDSKPEVKPEKPEGHIAREFRDVWLYGCMAVWL